MKRLLALTSLLAFALSSCGRSNSGVVNSSASNAVTQSLPASTASVSPGTTTAAAKWSPPILPDPKLTPGDTLDVTKDDICVPGYSRKVRDVPEAVKREAYARYGITSHKPREYEVDHLISLELGGSNSIKNLWPESFETQLWNAHVKDRLENELHRRVCSGELDLKTAQREIATDWISAYKKYLGEPGQERTTAKSGSRQPASSNQNDGKSAASSTGGVGTIVGNKRSKIYHRPDCPDYGRVSAENRVEFGSVEEAERAGYRLAGNCPR